MHWSPTSLWGSLRRPAYTGQLSADRYRFGPARQRVAPLRPVGGTRAQSNQERPRTEWIAVGTIPAIISQELFERVQEMLTRNQQLALRHAHAERYLLRALISCGQCRHWCFGRTCSRGSYAYYECTGRQTVAGRERCTASLIPVQELDTLVWQDLCDLLLHPDQFRPALERVQSRNGLPQERERGGSSYGASRTASSSGVSNGRRPIWPGALAG